MTNTGGAVLPTSYLGPRQSVYACPCYNRVHGWFSLNMQRAGSSSISSGSYAYNGYGWVTAWDYNPPVELFSQGLGGILLSDPTGLGTPIYRATSENQVVCPSDMIAFGDAPFARPDQSWQVGISSGFLLYNQVFPNFHYFYNEVVRSQPANANDPIVRLMAQRHGGRWNVGFCDGHVENLRGKDLFDFSNPNVARRWDSDHQAHNAGWAPPPR